MSGGRGDQGMAPGDVRPEARLSRPPGDRYRVPASDDGPVAQRSGRGLAAGSAAAAAVALVSGSLAAILDLDLGLLVVAAVGGWVIGQAVIWGTWPSAAHPQSTRPRATAAALGGLSWLGGAGVEWFLSQAILPASDRSLAQRLVETPFMDQMLQQLSVLDVMEVLLLVVIAWRTAR